MLETYKHESRHTTAPLVTNAVLTALCLTIDRAPREDAVEHLTRDATPHVRARRASRPRHYIALHFTTLHVTHATCGADAGPLVTKVMLCVSMQMRVRTHALPAQDTFTKRHTVFAL